MGGPDDERVYGHTRSDNGYYPWNRWGGQYDRDTRGAQIERGGYLKRHAPHTSDRWIRNRPLALGRRSNSATNRARTQARA